MDGDLRGLLGGGQGFLDADPGVFEIHHFAFAHPGGLVFAQAGDDNVVVLPEFTDQGGDFGGPDFQCDYWRQSHNSMIPKKFRSVPQTR